MDDILGISNTNTLLYKLDGSQLLSARKDGILNIYDGFERNQVLSSLDEHLDAINSLAISDKYIATAGNDGKVNVFDTKNNSFSKILLRSQVPVRDIDIDSNGSKVAIATDENTIRIVLINDVTNIVSLEGHQFTAKCVKFDPKNEYLLTSACDGTVNIWDMRHHTTPKLIKTFSRQFSTTGPDQLQSTILAWHPIHGNQFAMPGKNGSLHLVQRQKWSFVMTLKDTNNESNKDEINAIAWSSNGKYIATSAWQSSKLVIWDLTAKKLLTQKIMEDVVTAFVWNPNRNELIYTVSGRDELFYWKEPIPLSMKDPNSKSTTSSLPSEFTGSLRDEFDTELDHDDIGEDVDDDIVEIEDQGVNLDDDLFSEMESVADQERPPQQQQQHKVSRPAYRNDLSLEWPTRFQPGSTSFQKMVNDETPEENERRYLDFNLIGIVYTIYRTSNSIINVEFHNQSNNRNFHFSDYNHYSMAALGPAGLVLGVEGQEKLIDKKKKKKRGDQQQELDDLLNDDDDDDEEDDSDLDDLDDGDVLDEEGKKKKKKEHISSIIHFRPLNTWSNQKEWTVHLPIGEDVEAVAINDLSVIATTSMGYVRMYTLSGCQTHIFSIHDVVSMVARSDLLLLVCSSGPTIIQQNQPQQDQKQQLEFMIINTSDHDILQRGPLPISSGSELVWIGFSETSQPATYDSKSILRVLHRQRRPGQAAWVPLFDGIQTAKRREKTELYWPIGLLQDRLMCIILRGQLKEPYFPIPLATEIELRMPTVATDTKYDDLEESYLRRRITTLHEKDEADATNSHQEYESELIQADLEMDKALLQLIQLACKSDRFERALDLVNALHLSRSVDAAVQIASHHKLTTLAEKFITIKESNFLNQGQQVHQHTKTLHQFKENQPDLFSSSVSTMSSDLAFVDRSAENGSTSNKRRKTAYGYNNDNDNIPTTSTITTNDTTNLSMELNDITFDDDFNDENDEDLDMLMSSPLSKRTR